MSDAKIHSWRCEDATGEYLASTAFNLLDLEFINAAFASDDVYWAKPLSFNDLHQALSNSLTLGLYKVTPPSKPPKSADSPDSPRTPSPTLEPEKDEDLEQIGFARLITDRVTFAYLTDVYIQHGYRGSGLGKWLMKCCKELVDIMPSVRRMVLVTSLTKSKAFYERELRMWDAREEEGLIVMTSKPG